MKRELDIHSNKTKEILLICALSVVTTLFFFNRVIFTEENFAERDIILVYSPISAYVADRIAQGQFPDWSPYDGLGQPLAGMMFSAVFHPTKLLYLFLPLGLAMEWNVLLCFIFCCTFNFIVFCPVRLVGPGHRVLISTTGVRISYRVPFKG